MITNCFFIYHNFNNKLRLGKKIPKGSEILMMGVNIPDMIQIIKEHGLIPVPVDYNIDTMTPNNWDDIKALTSDKVRIDDLLMSMLSATD